MVAERVEQPAAAAVTWRERQGQAHASKEQHRSYRVGNKVIIPPPSRGGGWGGREIGGPPIYAKRDRQGDSGTLTRRGLCKASGERTTSFFAVAPQDPLRTVWLSTLAEERA